MSSTAMSMARSRHAMGGLSACCRERSSRTDSASFGVGAAVGSADRSAPESAGELRRLSYRTAVNALR